MVGLRVPNRAASRRAWVLGGALLLATVVIGVAVQPGTVFVTVSSILETVLFSASLLVFAFGIRGHGSLTARRPLGTAALTVLAIWALLMPLLQNFYFSRDYPPVPLLGFGYLDSFVRFAAALVAVIQIARAGVVPRPWNWAPTWALAAIAAQWLTEVVAIGSVQDGQLAAVGILGSLGALVRVGSAVFLGILAIVLANRPSGSQTVAVYPTSD
ncbi:hypothetical protein [Lacisediminihabitans sp.]|jgi:hypothetical protein|uniref:hypothetical protein n=1 Tax=Lacisediminihabitans sp. TaxID=2787631 RepID=UPI002F92A761